MLGKRKEEGSRSKNTAWEQLPLKVVQNTKIYTRERCLNTYSHVRGLHLQDDNWYAEFLFCAFFPLFLTSSHVYFPWVEFAPHIYNGKELLKTSCWTKFTQRVQQYSRTGKYAALNIFKGWESTESSSGRENTSEGKSILLSDQ